MKLKCLRDFNTLCIDGGGIKGIIPLCVLVEIERFTGRQSCEFFQQINGTSTGGIIAALLAKGYSAKEVLDMYLLKGRDIFKPIFGGWLNPFTWGSGRYDRKVIDRMCDDMLETTKMGELKTQFFCTAVNMQDSQWTHFMKSYKPNYADRLVADLVKRTYSAPTYFGYLTDSEGVWSDGGVGVQTCTLMQSYIETIRQRQASYWILNLGCGYIDALNYKPGKFVLSQIADFVPIARDQSIWQQQNDCRELGVEFYTANILVDKKSNEMDCVDRIEILRQYGQTLAGQTMPMIME